jgi:DNA polymerase
LEFFQELGVDGMRREAEWRTRRASAPAFSPDAGAPSVVTLATDRPDDRAASEPAPIFASAVDALAALKQEIGPACTRCKLHTLGRSQVVFGVGNPNADLMFVGEAPGADEDLQGEPFVGRAGQLLTKIIEAIGMKRDDVYIANVIKCRPPENRNPEPDELDACRPYIRRQIELIKPKVIVTLGKFAMQSLTGRAHAVSAARGVWTDYDGVRVMPTYHPAYLLRTPSAKKDVWNDMKKVMTELGI